MKARFSFWLLIAMLGLVACTAEDNPTVLPSEPDYVTKEPDYESVKCHVPVFLSNNIAKEVRLAVETYLTNISSIEDAEVAVVKSEDIPSYEQQLVNLYNRGGLIVLARPTGEHLAEFADKYEICHQLPVDTTQPILLFAFDNKKNCYVLFGNGPFRGEFPDDDDVLEITPSSPVNEVEQSDEWEDEQAYNKRRIFDFFRWVKTDRAQQAATRATTWVSAYDPYLFFRDCQHITHNFEVPMDHKVCKVVGCKADYLTTKASIEVSYDIYAAYVFEGNDNAGDYYIITRRVTAHNDDAYVAHTKKHGGVKLWLAGYFMRSLNLKSKLKDSSGRTDLKNALFASEVTPGTTVNSTSYTTGFSLGLDGALSVGTETGVSCGFNASYSSSNLVEISDLEIKKETDSQNRQVGHIYTVKNLPTIWSLDAIFVWEGIESVTNQIPSIAHADFDAISEWAWEVPAGTNEVRDNKNTTFTIYTSFDYEYGANITSNFGLLYSKDMSYTHTGACCQPISAPMRTPFGVLSLKNSHPETIANIKVWQQDANAGKGDPFITIPGSFGKGKTAKFALPVGTYYLEYNQMNGSTNEVINTWKIQNIKINNGSSEEESTNSVSTTDASVK